MLEKPDPHNEATSSLWLCSNGRNSPTGHPVNSSDETDSNSDVVFHLYYFGLLSALSFVSLCGNGMVLFVMVRQRHLRRPEYYFIFSLACSDTLLAVIYPIYNVTHINVDFITQTLGK